MNERFGVSVAVLSSAVGGAAAVATRYLIGAADPFTLAALRFGGGVLCLLPLALLLRVRFPPRQDWPAVAGLGFMFFGVFFVFYNVALTYTTVARGTLKETSDYVQAQHAAWGTLVHEIGLQPE